MKRFKFYNFLLCTALTLLSGMSAYADDTEVFFGGSSNSSSSINANILLILDTSGSMNLTATTKTQIAPYDPSTTYADNGAGCTSTSVYYWPKSKGNAPTSCGSSTGILSFTRSTLYCKSAVTALDGAAGYYGTTDFFIRLKKTGSNYTWVSDLSTAAYYVECKADNGVYGPSMTTADNKYPKTGNNGSTSSSYTTSSGFQWWSASNAGGQYYLFNPNYIRYLHSPTTTTRMSRLDTVKAAVSTLLSSISNSNVNVGLMRYDVNAHGGMVIQPIKTLDDTYLNTLTNSVNAFQPYGGTPLSETLYEAYQYLRGGPVTYGNTSQVCSSISNASVNDNGSCSSSFSNMFSVPSSRVGGVASSNTYDTPLDNTAVCAANNHIIYLTDGQPTVDTESNTAISSLVGHACSGGTGDGACLSDLTQYMFKHNLVSGNVSTVETHFIGFGADIGGDPAAQAYLQAAATAGGGQYHSATDISSLSDAFNSILAETVADTTATFVSPSVAVNSFNKTQVLEDMYIAMFQPNTTTHWDGNLKKFKLREITESGNTHLAVVGKDTATGLADETTSAVDPLTGFFKSSAADFWQAASDSNEDITTKGGAANLLPNPNTTPGRNVYTYIGTNTPGSGVALSGQPFKTSNANITDTLLGTSSSSCDSTTGGTNPCRSVLINWTRGDNNGNGINDGTTDVRLSMGDPVHSQPAVVIYANASGATTTTDKLNDALVFVATNDGFLHAIDVVSGVEQWSFIPQEVLSDLKNIYINDNTTAKHYSLDGDLRVLKYDVNNNGVIDTADGDRVILYFSQGRGGDSYYALDVTSKTNPKFLWSLDGSSGTNNLFGVVNQSWSTPTLGRVNVNGATQNSQKLVLIFGGGYDSAEDAQSYNASDTYGRGIFIVDAIRGTVLWRAGASTDTTANLRLTDMTHAIPSNVTVLDTDADGYSDRMYVGDMAGQLWRFDITNGNSAASLVAGGVIASLGSKAESTPSVANNRNFFTAPDVSKIVVPGGANYFNIAIGSGDRSLPKSNVTTQDRFYSIRDYQIAPMSQSAYNNYTKILDSNLTSVTGTTAPSSIDSRGWKLPLSSTEKVLAPSITLSGVILFTTFLPGSTQLACQPTTGSARSYAMNLTSGYKYFTNLYETFNTTGLPAQISVVNADNILRTDGTTASSSSSASSGSSSSSSSGTPAPSGTCLSGVSILGNCVDFGTRVKTFWQDAGAN